MPDREKVIKWMENCVKGYEKACPEDCPYFQQCFPDGKAIPFMPLMQDAISLLKEQGAEKPRVSTVEQRCGNCNKVIEMDGWKACPWCGKPILWEAVGRSVK